MNYTDDAFVTMLLTLALSPDKEEYAHPLSTMELNRLKTKVASSGMRSIGSLMNVDISGLMLKLDISEEEAYRIFTLLNRGIQLSYNIDSYLRSGIEVVTSYNEVYPARLKKRLGDAAPQVFYMCGNAGLLEKPMLSIVGIGGVRTAPDTRDAIETLIRNGVRLGYTIVTGGEPGVSRVAMNLVQEYGGNLVEVLGGELAEHIHDDGIALMIAEGRAAVLSFEHPEALFTVAHAIARNKSLFALSSAAFVFNTDGKRGEIDALRNRYCDWIYAKQGNPLTENLISRGAIPMPDFASVNMDEMGERWKENEVEQLNFFDMF